MAPKSDAAPISEYTGSGLLSTLRGEQEDKQAQARMILINFMQLLRVREGRAWGGKVCRVDSIVFYNSQLINITI